MTTKAGVLRKLTDGEAWTLLRAAAVAPADDDLVLGYAYDSMTRAEEYAVKNRATGHQVIGPAPAPYGEQGEAWAVLVIPPPRQRRKP